MSEPRLLAALSTAERDLVREYAYGQLGAHGWGVGGMNYFAALQAQRHEALFAELFAEPGSPEPPPGLAGAGRAGQDGRRVRQPLRR
ncbi:hypothetical protein [Deinococcus rubellus]|uniref:hypothetical protein n=1 Tax=Deinococcus rubellus TaxID=1889240 RepID=UPI0031E514E4